MLEHILQKSVRVRVHIETQLCCNSLVITNYLKQAEIDEKT